MPLNPQEFIGFLARHYRPLEAMCRERIRFTSDEEMAAFLRRYMDEDSSPARLINQMKDLSVLVQGSGDWSLPGFLVRFIREVQNRRLLASPQVIQSWVKKLEQHVTDLERHLDPLSLGTGFVDAEAVTFLLHEIADTFHTIVETVQDNCERIATEVAEYRTMEDAARMLSRLRRLIVLHDEYLEPVIQIIDITGDFHAVCNRISTRCGKLAVAHAELIASIVDDAKLIRQEVTWLRRVVVRRAEEAKRELGPLCEAAIRESRIAMGVNRALESIRLGDWARLRLEQTMAVAEEKDGSLFSDPAVQRYLRFVTQSGHRKPPRISADVPEPLEIPWTADALVEKLEEIESVEDLLAWVIETCGDVEADTAVGLLHRIIEHRADRAAPTNERRAYELGRLRINAACWRWGGANGE